MATPKPSLADLKEVVVRLDDLTWGDLADLERLTDAEQAALALAGQVTLNAAVVLMYLTLRRDDPEITLADVRALGVDVTLNVIASEGDEPAANPTEAAG